MKACPRCGEKNHDALTRCGVCGKDLSSWYGANPAAGQVNGEEDRSDNTGLLLVSSLWGLPALLVPLYLASQTVVKVRIAEPVGVGLVVGWVAVTFCSGALVAGLFLRPLWRKRALSPTFSAWALSGVPAMLAGAVMAAAYSLLPAAGASWSVDAHWQREAFFWAPVLGGTLAGTAGPLFAAMTLPVIRRIWPVPAERG